jgi:hypothetical protein
MMMTMCWILEDGGDPVEVEVEEGVDVLPQPLMRRALTPKTMP